MAVDRRSTTSRYYGITRVTSDVRAIISSTKKALSWVPELVWHTDELFNRNFVQISHIETYISYS